MQINKVLAVDAGLFKLVGQQPGVEYKYSVVALRLERKVIIWWMCDENSNRE
jgi:hypothetical protein